MPFATLTGNDTIVINNHVFDDLADGNVVELTYPNDIAAVKTGKNGNSLYALNESGRQVDVKMRVMRGSTDDKFLLGLLNAQQNDFAGFVLLAGQFVKKLGNGKGDLTADTYIVSGGVFTKQIEAKSNVEGDTEQSLSIYSMRFSNSPRVIT